MGRPVPLSQVCGPYFNDDDDDEDDKKIDKDDDDGDDDDDDGDDTDAFSCLQVWISMSTASLECKFILVIIYEEQSL